MEQGPDLGGGEVGGDGFVGDEVVCGAGEEFLGPGDGGLGWAGHLVGLRVKAGIGVYDKYAYGVSCVCCSERLM